MARLRWGSIVVGTALAVAGALWLAACPASASAASAGAAASARPAATTTRPAPAAFTRSASAAVVRSARSSGLTFTELARAVRALARERIAYTDDCARPRHYAFYTVGDAWRYSGAKGWAAGYVPGALWSCYQMTGDPAWRDRALRREAAIGSNEVTAASLNLGGLFFPTFVRGYTLTGDPMLRGTALRAARAMAGRYDPVVGAMRSRAGDRFDVIIDSLMKSRLLWWAARKGGDPALAGVATQHALTIARDFVRPDGSAWHQVFYDTTTGQVTGRSAGSAYSVDSTWARGQAWAVLGFAAAYRATADVRFLDVARKVTDWYLANLPADQVPYWDFADPVIPAAARDSSSAAIAASGMVELALADPSEARRAEYLHAARAILESLMSPAYLSLAANPAVLLHGTYLQSTGSADCGLACGDAFFLEALLRLRRADPPVAPLRVARVSTDRGNPLLAVDGDLTTSWACRRRSGLDLRLRGTCNVGSVRVALAGGDRRAAVLRVAVSADGRSWRNVLRTMTSGETAGFETLDFPSTRARWVRLSCEGVAGGAVNRIAEVRVLPPF